MRKTDQDVAAAVTAQLRNKARQASWATDPAGWARDVLGVHMWSKQREITDSVIHNKRTVVASCHGTGKALAVDTPIPTPLGPMPMGDLKTGMQVLGSDGTPTTITATTGIHTASRYRIVLEGPFGLRDIVASGEHLWPVLQSRPRAMAELKTSRAGLPLHTGMWQHQTRAVTTVELKKMVGSHQRITIPAETPHQRLRGPRWEPDPWLSDLLLQRGGSTREGRPALFWETHHAAAAPAEIAKVRSWLSAQGVHSLLQKRREGQGVTWSLAIAGDAAIEALPDLDARAVALTRKHVADGGIGHPGWRVKSVKRIADGPVQCIEVDAPNHLFLCGLDGIPTHNSMISSVLICWWISTKPLGDAIAVSCFTDDTEVLTREGWKLFKDVRTGFDGDEFATRDPATKNFEWQHAFRYHEEPWDGEIVDIKGRSVDLRVTPNHRMVVQWSTYNGGVKTVGETFKRADAIGPRGAELPARSNWEGETPKTVQFGKYTWDAVDFAAFLGAYLAEGSLGPKRAYVQKGGYAGSIKGNITEMSGSIAITQLPDTKGYEPYRELLTRMIGKEPTRSVDKDWVFACSDLYKYLEPLGKAGEKYIPEDVKNWGPEALEKLLEFYLLGDGWFQKSTGKRAAEGYGSWRSCTVSKRLADDLQEIAQKVGRHATITERAPRDGGTFEGGRQILKENCRTGYYLIFGDCQTKRIKATRSHYKGNVYCVSVPNETIYVRRGGSPIWVGNTAPTYAQVNRILWEEIRKHHATAKRRGTPLPGYVTQADEWKAPDGKILAFGRKPAHGDRHGFQGIHRRFVLAVLDEACGVPEELWTGVEAITTNDGCRILAVGNPDDRNTEFGAVYTKPENAQDWNRVSVPAFSTPNFTGEEVPPLLNEVLISKAWEEERRRAWGKDDPRYISKILAEFPEQSQSSLFPPAVINQAFDEAPPQPSGDILRLGVDVSRFGTDETVVVSYAGKTARIEDKWSGTDTVSSAVRVLHLAREMRDRLKSPWVEIRVDAVGLGAGVVDTLNARAALEKEPWYSVYEMHGSASPPVDLGGSVHGYGNARAYWYDQLRHMMRNGSVQVEDNQTLRDDLAIVFYFFRSGKLFIIPKEEMRKKHGRSPDYADALVYATAPVAEGLEEGSLVSEEAADLAREMDDLELEADLSIAPF